VRGLLAVLMCVAWVSAAAEGATAKKMSPLKKLVESIHYIQDSFYKEVDVGKCVDQILSGGVSKCTDRWSHYESAEEDNKEALDEYGEKDQSVYVEKPEAEIGYVKIKRFISETRDDFEAAVIGLNQNGMKVLVLDLRDNPGGRLHTVIGIITFFKSDEEPILYEVGRDGKEVPDTPYESNRGIFKELKVVVLINKESYSAAELLAGWLKEDFGAPVVGEVSFGKDLIQKPFEFEDGSALYVTYARYLIGKGKLSIGGVGVKPTLEVKNPEGQGDAQMQKAIETARRLAVLSH